jgi:hypothetical protein
MKLTFREAPARSVVVCINAVVRRHRSFLVALFCCFNLQVGMANAGEVYREQTIQLHQGWNAVHLEVEPSERKPASVFEGKPIDIAARYFRLVTPVQFISDPADEPWKAEGWGVWYAPLRDDAFLTNLHAIQGNQTYLIHATEDYEWKVTGKVRYQPVKWRHDSYNLVGFTVDEQSPPTFGEFFSSAGGKIGTKIYRLSGENWVKVIDPDTTRMRSGEAAWIFCDGKTSFSGPIALDVSAQGLLDFGLRGNELSLGWKHQSVKPQGISVELVAPAGSTETPLPLRVVERDLDTLTDSATELVARDLGGIVGIPAGELKLQLRRDEMSSSEQGGLLKFTTSDGAVAWLPVTASRPTQ